MARTYEDIHKDYRCLVARRAENGYEPLTHAERTILDELEKAERHQWCAFVLNNPDITIHDA